MKHLSDAMNDCIAYHRASQYNEAAELDPTDMVFHMNIGGVLPCGCHVRCDANVAQPFASLAPPQL